MEVEVILPVSQQQHHDFNFDSTVSSPYITAPSSPQLFGFGNTHGGSGQHHFYHLSAPTSPTGSPSSFFRRELNRSRNSLSSIPFKWEEKPGIPKHKSSASSVCAAGEEDFEFDFSGQLDVASWVSASADELFDGGKIRPLKPPPRLQVGARDYDASPSPSPSPRAPGRGRFSPKKRAAQSKDFDPFTKALEETTRTEPPSRPREDQQQRGRDRNIGSSSSSSSYTRRMTRSLSPFRVSDIIFHQQDQDHHHQDNNSSQATKTTDHKAASSYFSTLLSSISFSKRGYRKWSFRDFLLFRSASEGRGTSSDPLRKFPILNGKTVAEDSVKSSSFRSTDSTRSSVSRSRRRRRSAHELHYTVNRAASEEMRKKTFLPYKQGLLGCLGFNPGVHELAKGIGSLTRGHS